MLCFFLKKQYSRKCIRSKQLKEKDKNLKVRQCPKQIQLFLEKGCQKKMCSRQSRKVIWDMINTVTVFCCFPLAHAKSMASCAILSNFFEEQ